MELRHTIKVSRGILVLLVDKPPQFREHSLPYLRSSESHYSNGIEDIGHY